MEDKALMALMVDMLDYYKRQSKLLIWIVVAILVMHVGTIVVFLYYESTMETTVTTTKTTTQTVDGQDNDIVNGDQYNDESQNKGVTNVSDPNRD